MNMGKTRQNRRQKPIGIKLRTKHKAWLLETPGGNRWIAVGIWLGFLLVWLLWKGGGARIVFSLPECPFRMLTGFLCPGCGGTRALEALSHGQVIEALRQNLLVPGTIFILAGWSIWLFFHSFCLPYHPPAWRFPVWLGWIIGIGVAIFWVLRNVFLLLPD